MMSRTEAEELVRTQNRFCRGKIHPEAHAEVLRLLDAGDNEGAIAADNAGRVWCGYNVNDLICAEPFDGKLHEVACPKCGNRIDWTPMNLGE